MAVVAVIALIFPLEFRTRKISAASRAECLEMVCPMRRLSELSSCKIPSVSCLLEGQVRSSRLGAVCRARDSGEAANGSIQRSRTIICDDDSHPDRSRAGLRGSSR